MTLLERWAKAEPERVSIGKDCAFLTSGYGDIAGIPASWAFAVESTSDPKVLGFIVAAIEARGWEFALERNADRDDMTLTSYAAYVYGGGEEGPDAFDDLLGEGHREHASEALLTAYLDALSAVSND